MFRVRSRRVNCHLVRDGSAFTLADSGLPRHWPAIRAACDALGPGVSAVEAVLLTHVHADHAGGAEQARVEAGATVSLHAGDADLASGRAHRKNQRPLAAYLWRPAALAATWELAAGGGRRMPAIGSHNQVEDGQRLDLPGRPVVVGLPGHTLGSVGYTLPDRGVCFSGDALVTWNLLTGRRGPQLLAAGFMEDTTKALASLDRLAELDASILLPGHGEPWTGPMSQAVTQARNAGIS